MKGKGKGKNAAREKGKKNVDESKINKKYETESKKAINININNKCHRKKNKRRIEEK